MFACLSLAGLMSLDSSSIDDVISLSKSLEFHSDQLLGNIYRVLKPGGTILLHLSSQPAQEQLVICLWCFSHVTWEYLITYNLLLYQACKVNVVGFSCRQILLWNAS